MNLGKYLLFMCLIFSLVGCGQKSVVKPSVTAKTFAEAYGDGHLLRQPLILPITTDPFASPIDINLPIAGGIAKMLGNIVAALGGGTTEKYFHQPSPEVPDRIRDVRLKRVFFYIEPKKNGSRRVNWFRRIFMGKGDVDFNFINKLALRIKPEMPVVKKNCPLPVGPYEPIFPCKDPDLTTEHLAQWMGYFTEKTAETEPDLSEKEDFVILKYDGQNKSKSILNNSRGPMFMFRTPRPGETTHFFDNRGHYKELIQNLVVLDNVILVELKNDPVAKESFEMQLSQDAIFIDETLGVEQIEECNPSICLDLKLEKANLVPFLKKMNSNRIDAFINAGKVPETFQLKGFVEFDVGIFVGF